MTATGTPRRRRGKIVLAVVLAVCLLALGMQQVIQAGFWEQVGWRLVAAVQDRLLAELTVERVSGNLLTGMVFSGVSVRRQGEVLLEAAEVEISVALLSFVRLQPVIRTLIIRRPQLHLRLDQQGQWNASKLLQKRSPPPFTRLHLPHIQVISGSLELQRPERTLTVQDIHLQLNLTIKNPGRPQLMVLVQDATVALEAPPWPRLVLDAEVTASLREILLPRAVLTLAEVPPVEIAGTVTDWGDTPRLDLRVQVPKVSGTSLRRLWPAWPGEFSGRADLTLKGPLSDLEWAARGEIQESRWQGHGTWRRQPEGDPEWTAALQVFDLRPGMLPIPGKAAERLRELPPLSGSLTGSGRGLPWKPAVWQARLDLQPFTVQQTRVDGARVVFSGSGAADQRLTVEVQGNFGRLEALVQGHWWWPDGLPQAAHGSIRLTTAGLNPALLPAVQAPAGALDLNFTGTWQVPSPAAWQETRLLGTLQARGRLRDTQVQEFFCQGGWNGRELHFAPARLRLGGLAATAQGRLGKDGVNAAASLTLSPDSPWPGISTDLRGRLEAQGTIQGPWQALDLRADLRGRTLSWRRFRLEGLQAEVAGSVSPGAWKVSGFHVNARGLDTALGHFGLLTGTGRTQNGRLNFELVADRAPGGGGRATGAAAWEAGAVQIRLQTFQWGPPARQATISEPCTLTFGPGRFQISPVRLHYGDTVLSAAVQASVSHLEGVVRLEKLRLADFTTLLPPLRLFQGTVQAQVELGGSGQHPEARGQLQINAGRIGKWEFDTFATTVSYLGQQLSITGHLLEKPDQGRLAWQGTAPITLRLFPWSWQIPDQGLQGRLWTEKATLALFSQLIPQVSVGEGPMDLQVTVSGSLRQPVFQGALRYGPGTLTIRESGAPLALEEGEIRLAGNRLTVGRLVFQSGQGRGEITGGAELRGLHLTEVQLVLQAMNLLAIRRAGSWAVANGQVQLSGTWPAFKVAGRLVVTPGQFRLGFFRPDRHQDIIILPRHCTLPDQRQSPAGAAAVVRHFTLDLTVEIPGDVWLRDKDVNIDLEGKIQVLRQPPGPRFLGGWVKAKEGVFAINNKPFTIDKAMLIFPGAPHKPIRAEARASRQVDDYTLSVFAFGPLDSLRTGLESNPPLPPRDQLSLLLFDHLADKMTREEYITVTQRAMGLLGSLTARQLKTLLGEKLPILGEVSPTTSQEAVGVGKRLGRGLTVSYERRLNPLEGEDVNQVRLNYKIHKYFSAETQLGRKNPGGDLFFNLDF